MSRTHRRKGRTPRWVTHDWVFDKNTFTFNRIALEGDELKKVTKQYHSDSTRWVDMSSIPQWFRRLYGHKRDRADTRRKLSKELNATEYGNEVFNKARDISWDWY